MAKKKTVMLSVRLSAAQMGRIVRAAKKDKVSVAEVVRQSLDLVVPHPHHSY